MEESAQDELACARLMVKAVRFADLHRIDDFVTLFAEDGSVERMGEMFAGIVAIRQFMTARNRDRRTRHVLGVPLIEFDGADAARGAALFTLFDGQEEGDRAVLPISLPATVGEFRQTYRRVGEVWKIIDHRSVAVFRRT